MNIYICYSPLHAYISYVIAKEHFSNERNIFIIIIDGDKKAFDGIKRLMVQANLETYVYENDLYNKLKVLFFFGKLKKVDGGVSFFCGNYKKIFSRLVARVCLSNKLYAFDDGFGSVSGCGYFYENDRSINKKIILSLLNFEPYLEYTKKIICTYSIFPSLKNSFDKVKYVSLSSAFSGEGGSSLDRFSVFIGSPLAESGILTLDDECKYFEFVVSKIKGPILYLPHPRESKVKISKLINGFQHVRLKDDIDDVAEVFIIKNKNCISSVYGFFSTVLVLVAPYMDCNVYFFMPKEMHSEVSVDVMRKSGVKKFNVEDDNNES